MNGIAFYAVIFVAAVAVISFIAKFTSRYKRTWDECARKYRLSFKETDEERNGEAVRVLRVKGHYRTCLLSINSIPTSNRKETIITVSYPKNLLNSLSRYPSGIMGRVSKGLARQLNAPSSTAFFVTLPAGSAPAEVKKQLNSVLKEQLIQLMIACGGKGRQIEVTDAYVMCKQASFTKDPALLIPIVDEMISFINMLETTVDDLLI